jgi:ADP-heptose:LPS heptosyltransferase
MNHLLLSRTDNLGDVMLSLPLAGFLKKKYPQLKISFIGKSYTKALIESCEHVDEFIDKAEILNTTIQLKADAIIFLFPDKELARAVASQQVKYRIGTSNRWFHWLYCNKKVYFSRKKSTLHEAQLNFKLLKGLGIDYIPNLEEISDWYGFHNKLTLAESSKIITKTPLVILHPKSNGSAQEWKPIHYLSLAKKLNQAGIQVIITGTEKEGKHFLEEFPNTEKIDCWENMCGKLDLKELIAQIEKADAIVACSTGPLHIAAALGEKTFGLYIDQKPIHPGRWAAVGKQVEIILPPFKSFDINQISPEIVYEKVINAISKI